MNSLVAEIQAFIRQRHPVVSAFLITQKRDGLPYVRQIGTFVEGWTIQTISQPTGDKMAQIRRNPAATYLWVQQFPDRLSKNVWIQGEIEIVEDQTEVERFLERRAKALGQRDAKTPAINPVLLRMEPRYLRSEHFRENPREFIMRQFPPTE